MIFFFDYDGTLSINRTVSEKCIKAVSTLKEKGHTIILNSGRAYAVVPKELKESGLFDGYICGSTFMMYHGAVEHNDPLSMETLKEVYDTVTKEGIPTYFEGVKENFSYNLKEMAGTEAKELFERKEPYPEITKLTFGRKGEEMNFHFKNLRLVKFPTYTEGIKEGYDKSTLMAVLLKKLGSSIEDTVAFGDSANDTDMLKFVNKAIVMKNAPKEFDDFAFYRAKEADGVPEAIYKFFV